jgi:hypothetical protein
MVKLISPGPVVVLAATVFGLLMALRSSVSGTAARSAIAGVAFATMAAGLLWSSRLRKKH